MKFNFNKVLLSGVISGAVIIISALGMIPIVGDQMNEVLQRCSLPPLSNAAMLYFASMSIILGITIILIFAYVESNYKSKMKVAILVSILVWFLTYFWSNAALVAYGFMPFKLAAIGTAWGLFEVILASIIGAKLYINLKEK